MTKAQLEDKLKTVEQNLATATNDAGFYCQETLKLKQECSIKHKQINAFIAQNARDNKVVDNLLVMVSDRDQQIVDLKRTEPTIK